jgi:hypothetical protein
LSVNKLGEYMTARAGRQNKILYDAKHPQDYITPFYRDASEAIAKAIADGLEDISSLERAIRILDDKNPTTVSEVRRCAGNIDAIETFIDIMGDVNLKGVEPRLGSHQASHLVIHGVEISVRPEVTLHLKKRNGAALVGGIKLHFPKTFPLNGDAADYISACVQLFARDHLAQHGVPSPAHCYVIDMASATVFPGAKAIKSRIRDVEETCKQIASIWPTI